MEMWIGPSFSITPPTCSARWASRDLLRALVALDDVQALDVRRVCLLGSTRRTLPVLPRSLPPITMTVVVAADSRCRHGHSTSGASETIFMKLRSRSSRATGPKMRVPRGLFWASMSTAAFSSKAM